MKKLDRVAVVGGGPVGLVLTYHLAKSGSKVYLFEADKSRVSIIKSEGLKITGLVNDTIKLEDVFSNFTHLPENEKKFDLVIFSTKAYHTFSAAKKFKMGVGTFPVLSAQNGIDTEEILIKVFGESNTFRMIINWGASLVAPNVVKLVFFMPPNYIASIDDSKKELAEVFSSQLSLVNLHTQAIDSFDIIKYEWEKTILNSAMSPICAITKMTMREVMENADLVDIVKEVIREAIKVAKAEGIYLEKDFLKKSIRYLKKAGHHLPSLAFDLINERELEIDYLNGKVVEYGKKHYIKTPVNLLLCNLIKGISSKAIFSSVLEKSADSYSSPTLVLKEHGPCYLGVDLGYSYTKIVLIGGDNNIVFKSLLKSVSRDKASIKSLLNSLYNEYPIKASCATGYGRKHFLESDIIKTEINCAAKAANLYIGGEKSIIDIGAENIKIIQCDSTGSVKNFLLNDKCSAGTGAFLAEISNQLGISTSEMQELAKHSNYNKPLNSFCTVFAKTEIIDWIFDGLPVQDIARGIYLSVASRVSKLRIDTSIPVILIGGVAQHHPFLKEILEGLLKTQIYIPENPQYIVALGAALMAKEFASHSESMKKNDI